MCHTCLALSCDGSVTPTPVGFVIPAGILIARFRVGKDGGITVLLLMVVIGVGRARLGVAYSQIFL